MAALSAPTVCIPTTEGQIQSAAAPCGTFSTGLAIAFTMSGKENHCGAERPKRTANSIADFSNLSCSPVARYRSNRVSQVSTCSARSAPGARISSNPASAAASSPLANKMAASSSSASCSITGSPGRVTGSEDSKGLNARVPLSQASMLLRSASGPGAWGKPTSRSFSIGSSAGVMVGARVSTPAGIVG